MNDKDLSSLKKFEDAVTACNRCGFCTSYCPTYNATGNEVHSPRGRNQLFRALIEGKISDTDQVRESIDTCLLCGECTSVCFSEVPTAQLMMHARSYLNAQSGMPKAAEFFLKNILPYRGRFVWMLRLAFLGKKLGISWLLRKTGVLARFAPPLAAADELVESVPLRFLMDYKYAKFFHEQTQLVLAQAKSREAHSTGKPASSASLQRAKVAYMPVCGSQYLRPSVGLATLRLFNKLKIDFSIPDVTCCGLPASSLGAGEQARQMARSNIAHLERGHYESIVIDDSSCATHMKDLPKILQDDPMWLKRAHDLSQKIRDLSTLLLQRGLKDHLKLVPWTGGPVAFHDPCKAQYGQRITRPPRELLSAVSNLKLVPIADADQCCGGAGTFSFTHPEMSQDVLSAKVENIAATGCSILVTSSASCLTQLESGLRKKNPKIEVLHITEFLVRALSKRK